MANASAKRIAGQNDATIKTLRLGMIIPTILSLFLRLVFRRSSLPPSKSSIALYAATFIPSFFLSNYLVRIGSPRRDPTTGTLMTYGEDLSQQGITEWCFDIIYITWACQIGSGAFGEWVWWFYLVIPLYAVYKLWSSLISPMLLGRGAAPASTEDAPTESVSKRQDKLRKRQERGDPRVQSRSVRK
ncbi:hypothetical protein EYR40_005523 [Pleurotus pulmonarius]|nr:hypothetical protein EYR36_006090 [Pleurotus pulmonarius]KAF4600797.1 hypothetical protein EYR38_005442 [Pleurotus pulmonarius]KAF4602318.1 hypothetical protein EYR40_005523 [Pleurotus pulmonarius]